VAQSGGPTAVINASLAGVVQEARRHRAIQEVYGGANGILGVLAEDLIDFNGESLETLPGLRHTPGAALGTCRYKIDFKKNPGQAAQDMDRLFQVFQAHDIRHFIYLGGNDSQDTSLKVHQEALGRGWQLRVIGVPKTIDNDLAGTDNCPGYGSVIKFNATTVMEIGLDVGSMATEEGACCLVEAMGRRAGWIAAGTVLAKRGQPANPPHIILLPEVALDEEKFLRKVQETVAALKYCVVVVGEGVRDAAGQEVGVDLSRLDAFGHPVLAGAAQRLQDLVQNQLRIKARSVMLGYAQRVAAHWASRTDVDNAFACGRAAVRAALHGHSGQMVRIERALAPDGSVKWSTGLAPLADIANVEHLVPRDWISEDGFLPNERFVEYARPLIEGEVKIPTEAGLPRYVTLAKRKVGRKLAPLSRG